MNTFELSRDEVRAEPRTIRTTSEQGTIELGHSIGQWLVPGDVVALVGPLGSGKTCFVKGLAQAWSVGQDIRSPSFTFVRPYPSQRGCFVHVDAFRIEVPGQWDALGLDEYLETDALLVIEWANRVDEWLPSGSLFVAFEYCDVSVRELSFSFTRAHRF